MPTPLDDLDDLLATWRSLAKQHPHVLTEAGVWNDLEFQQLRSDLTGWVQRGKPVIGALEWWRSHESDYPDDSSRAEALTVLLTALDDHFSGNPTRPVTVAGGFRLIGQRWWWTTTAQPRAPFSVQEPFRCLMRGTVEDDEWIYHTSLRLAFAHALRGDRLRVGLSALTGACRTTFEGTRPLGRGIYGFRGASVAPPEVAAAELRECVAWAAEHGVHVLIFPELAIDAEGRDILRGAIQESPGEICFVVPGSFHGESERDASRYANAAPLWAVIGRRVETIGVEEKAEPLTTSAARVGGAVQEAARSAGCSTVREDIRPDGRVRLVSTPIGILAVVICRDGLTEAAEGAFGDVSVRAFRAADHVLLISMNGSPSAWFWSRAELIARQFEAATFYVNADHVITPQTAATVDLAFWRLPYRPASLVTTPEGYGDRARLFRSAPSASDDPAVHKGPLPDSGRALVDFPVSAVDYFAGGAH
jgi:hypothetical protein